MTITSGHITNLVCGATERLFAPVRSPYIGTRHHHLALAVPKKTPKSTIVVLALRPSSEADEGESLLRIAASGVGRELDQAELELNEAIRDSERGRRHLVPLHRLRALRVHSKATALAAADDALPVIYEIAGEQEPLALPGFFRVDTEEAIAAISAGLVEYEKRAALRKKRQRQAAQRRKELDRKKRILAPTIEAVVYEDAPHSQELCDALDGREGKSIQSWAAKQLAKFQKKRERAEEQSRVLRERTVQSARNLEVDLVQLHAIHSEIAQLTEEDYALSEGEENLLMDLEMDAEEILSPVHNWRDALSAELRPFADHLVERIEESCPHGHSFHALAKRVLIDQWDLEGN